MEDEEVKLNIGSGDTKIKGFLNLDKQEKYADVVHELSVDNPLPYKDKEVTALYSSHIIEHFWWYDTLKVLEDWCRVLKDGGTLEIWTVDFDILVYHHLNCQDKDYLKSLQGINWRLFSKDRYEGDAHHACFTYPLLQALLKKAGFKDVKKLNPTDYQFKPMHNGINLGVVAIK